MQSEVCFRGIHNIAVANISALFTWVLWKLASFIVLFPKKLLSLCFIFIFPCLHLSIRLQCKWQVCLQTGEIHRPLPHDVYSTPSHHDQWWPILMAYPYGSQCHGKKYLKNLNNECDPRRVSSLLHPLWLLLPSARPLNSALSMDQWWLVLVNGQAAGITESFSFWLRKHPNKSW